MIWLHFKCDTTYKTLENNHTVAKLEYLSIAISCLCSTHCRAPIKLPTGPKMIYGGIIAFRNSLAAQFLILNVFLISGNRNIIDESFAIWFVWPKWMTWQQQRRAAFDLLNRRCTLFVSLYSLVIGYRIVFAIRTCISAFPLYAIFSAWWIVSLRPPPCRCMWQCTMHIQLIS